MAYEIIIRGAMAWHGWDGSSTEGKHVIRAAKEVEHVQDITNGIAPAYVASADCQHVSRPNTCGSVHDLEQIISEKYFNTIPSVSFISVLLVS